MKRGIIFSLLAVGFIACNSEEQPINVEPKNPTPDPVVEAAITTPNFNEDSAYAFIQKQVDFGPRVPNTVTHDSCGAWLKRKLKGYGFELTIQKAQAKAWTGAMLNIENIMAQYLPEEQNRIMLCAHWDTRPYADKDTEDQQKPIDGANDGGSGVGVLLEIARQISLLSPETGVDIVFFYTEDYGAPSAVGMNDISSMNDSWCLGSQYWSKNLPIPNYRPRYGILLDMVGAKNATFPKEGLSNQFAGQQVNRIWKEAEALGYEKQFTKMLAPPIIDDHKYINEVARIPTLDIIHYKPVGSYGGFEFGHFHHTHKDNMDVISKETLKAVGQTVLHVVYQKI